MRTFISMLLLLTAALPVAAAPPSDDLVAKLTEAIQTHCPEAKIEVTDEGFAAKHGTMMFTLHSRSKTGEVHERTYREEGPNFQGFMLNIALMDGKYAGAAAVPQTLKRPYFPTFIDAVPVNDGKQYYQIHFSYGSRLDAKLKQAILDLLPSSIAGQPSS